MFIRVTEIIFIQREGETDTSRGGGMVKMCGDFS